MKTQILVLQGAGEGAHEWDMPLIHALKEELGDHYQIHFPKMPNEERPTYEAWTGKIDQVLQTIPDPVVVLGHSLGGSVILKYLTEGRTDRKLASIFLISSPFWGAPDWHSEEFQLNPGVEDKLNNRKLFIYHSKNDPYVPFEHLDIYKKHLPSASVRIFEDAGHEMVKVVPKLVEDISRL